MYHINSVRIYFGINVPSCSYKQTTVSLKPIIAEVTLWSLFSNDQIMSHRIWPKDPSGKSYLWNWTDFLKLFSIQHNKIRNHVFFTSVLSAGFSAEIMKISCNMKIFDFQLIEENGLMNKNLDS